MICVILTIRRPVVSCVVVGVDGVDIDGVVVVVTLLVVVIIGGCYY